MNADDFDLDAALAKHPEPELAGIPADELTDRIAVETTAYANLDPFGFEVTEKGKRVEKSTINFARALELFGVRPRYNAFACEREKDDGRLDEPALDDLRVRCMECFKFLPQRDDWFRYVDVVARRRSYHPVIDYLSGLAWDGVPRIGSWLVTYAGVEDTPYARAVGRLVLVAACRRVRQPGAKFDEMLVLEGATGWGKQRVLKILAVRDAWYTNAVPLGEDSKAMIEQTRGKWIVEMDELDGMSKHHRNKLKASLSRGTDAARLAYARETVERPRQYVMIGSTNEHVYLDDPTGNRRWWPARLGRPFDLDAVERDRDMLWAEAAAAEAAGESIRLDESLWSAAAAEQEQRRGVDPYELRLAVLANLSGHIGLEDLWALAGCAEDPTPAQRHRVAAAVQAMGWQKARRMRGGDRAYCYSRGESERWWTAAEARGAAAGNTQPDLRVVQ